MIIKKGGCSLETTMEKYVRHYKRHGYKIVEHDPINLEEMTYKELQALYKLKFEKSPFGIKKEDILKALNEVV